MNNNETEKRVADWLEDLKVFLIKYIFIYDVYKESVSIPQPTLLLFLKDIISSSLLLTTYRQYKWAGKSPTGLP